MKLYAIPPTILQVLAWPIVHSILKICGRFEVVGINNLSGINKQPIIIASNHVNELDSVLIRAALPMFSPITPMFWVARPKYYYGWKGWRSFVYGDWFFNAWGAYGAVKGNKDYSKALEKHITILKDGGTLCIYPKAGKEQYLGREKAETHGGVAYLMQETSAVVVPTYVGGTLGVNAKKLFFGRPKFKVIFGNPIYSSKTGDINYKEEAEKIMQAVYQLEE